MHMPQFERYLDAVCSGILSDKARDRVRQEMLDHLTCRMEEREAQGMDETDAAEDALRCFGDETDVRTQITRAHRVDNGITIFKGVCLFLLWQLIAAFVLFLEIVKFAFSGVHNADLLFSSFLFLLLIGLSLYAARKKKALLPLCLIPTVLVQGLLFMYERPMFLIALPELFSGRLIAFLRDLAQYDLCATAVSKIIAGLFILLFIAADLLLSVSSFRLKANITQSLGIFRFARGVLTALLALTLVSLPLCCCSAFVSPVSHMPDVEEYYLIPANSDAEIQDILRFYTGRNITSDLLYPCDEAMYLVKFDRGLSLFHCSASCYVQGDIPKNDNSILREDAYFEDWQDHFYGRYVSLVEIAPQKTAGYYVAVPVNGGVAQTERATVIPLPLEDSTVIDGQLENYRYEIHLTKSNPT